MMDNSSLLSLSSSGFQANYTLTVLMMMSLEAWDWSRPCRSCQLQRFRHYYVMFAVTFIISTDVKLKRRDCQKCTHLLKTLTSVSECRLCWIIPVCVPFSPFSGFSQMESGSTKHQDSFVNIVLQTVILWHSFGCERILQSNEDHPFLASFF